MLGVDNHVTHTHTHTHTRTLTHTLQVSLGAPLRESVLRLARCLRHAPSDAQRSSASLCGVSLALFTHGRSSRPVSVRFSWRRNSHTLMHHKVLSVFACRPHALAPSSSECPRAHRVVLSLFHAWAGQDCSRNGARVGVRVSLLSQLCRFPRVHSAPLWLSGSRCALRI